MRGERLELSILSAVASETTVYTIPPPARFKIFRFALILFPTIHLVGARGFEPPTPCTPCKCATRLRYAPINLVKLNFLFFCVDSIFRPFGRSERIRTSDPLHPMQVRYQAALRSDSFAALKKFASLNLPPLHFMVGAAGFEPATLWSQTRCATRLRYAPTKPRSIFIFVPLNHYTSYYSKSRIFFSNIRDFICFAPMPLSTRFSPPPEKQKAPKRRLVSFHLLVLSAVSRRESQPTHPRKGEHWKQRQDGEGEHVFSFEINFKRCTIVASLF